MVNLFYISIGQDDCPHTYLTGKIKDLTIFIMNTQELEDGYQTTFSLFFAKDVENLQETMRLLKEYPGIRNINVLGVKDQVMSLTYTFPRTSAFSHVKENGKFTVLELIQEKRTSQGLTETILQLPRSIQHS